MYALFMVGAKLLGLYFIFCGALQVLMLNRMGSAAMSPFFLETVIACVFWMGIGILLAFFTGLVAKAVRIQDKPADQTPMVVYAPALEVGIILLGLWQILSQLPRVIVRVTDYLQEIARSRDTINLFNVETIGLVAAISLVLFAHRIAALLERFNRHSSGPSTI